jgi:predicted nucleic acid-binding protein
MNGNSRYLLDTNAIISLLGGNAKLNNIIIEADWLGISIISELEFLAYPNLDATDISLFNTFKNRISVVDLSEANSQVIKVIIQIRKEKKVKLPDAVIMGTSIASNAILLTADDKLLKIFPNDTKTF